MSAASAPDTSLDVETVIVGAGFSGIGAAIEIQRRDLGSYVILEKADDVGGTWQANTYPGIAVDVPSIAYSFSFENDYPWSREYAPGREIQAYARMVAEKYGVTSHIRFGAAVERAVFDETAHRWTIHLGDGSVLRSRYLITCTGLLSVPKWPEIEGRDTFAGDSMHTAEWDHSIPLEGRRVGIIGTGASAVQIIPSIAPEVGHLSVFQRTPVWVGPRRDRALRPGGSSALRRLRRWITEGILQLASWMTVSYSRSKKLLARVEAAQEAYIRRSIEDPELREKLVPDYGFGCKRPTFSNDYLRAFNRDNVSLVTDAIERITPQGIVTADGVLHELDVLVYATGFKTMERGNAPSFAVHGLAGRELGKWWYENRYQAYAGVSVPGFPNLFLSAGPYSGGLNWFDMLEPHMHYIGRIMRRARRSGTTWVEVRNEAHDRYMADMWKRAENAVFKNATCATSNSYYIDHKGDASLGYLRTPWFRWFRVRLSRLTDFRFAP